MQEKKQQLGRYIRTQRESRNLSSEELAHIIDLSRKSMGKIERGETLPSLMTYVKLVKVLDLDHNYVSDQLLQDIELFYPEK